MEQITDNEKKIGKSSEAYVKRHQKKEFLFKFPRNLPNWNGPPRNGDKLFAVFLDLTLRFFPVIFSSLLPSYSSFYCIQLDYVLVLFDKLKDFLAEL